MTLTPACKMRSERMIGQSWLRSRQPARPCETGPRCGELGTNCGANVQGAPTLALSTVSPTLPLPAPPLPPAAPTALSQSPNEGNVKNKTQYPLSNEPNDIRETIRRVGALLSEALLAQSRGERGLLCGPPLGLFVKQVSLCRDFRGASHGGFQAGWRARHFSQGSHIYIYVYIYIYMYTYTYTYICIYIYMHTPTYAMHMCVYIYISMHMHMLHIHIHACMYAYACAYACTYVLVFACACACAFAILCSYTCTYR